jgi:hypothetical protein
VGWRVLLLVGIVTRISETPCISVVSSICHEKNGAIEISFSISLFRIAVIDSKILFCIIFEVPENTDLLSRIFFKLGLCLLKKEINYL